MALGSFSRGALVELSAGDLGRMLKLDETLFVEHKSDIGDDTAYGLISAVASFANTVGGWLLIGVKDGRPTGAAGRWADPERSPTLVDAVRTRLRGEIDSLPPFEARVIEVPDGPVGVVRVYESADTPHVVLASGSVFVREVVGKSDLFEPKRPGGGARGERAYRAERVRSRAQLLDLAAKGREASARVGELLDPERPLPLINAALGLSFGRDPLNIVRPEVVSKRGSVVVRLVPYTPAPRFRGWATTVSGASALLDAAKELSDLHGLAPNSVMPDPAGASFLVGPRLDARHQDATGIQLETACRVVIDGAGVVGAAFELGSPSSDGFRRPVRLDELATRYIGPVLKAAADVLIAGEFLGRARCQIDLIGVGMALLVEGQSSKKARSWVPTAADLALPADEAEVHSVALRAAYAFGRSAGVAAWDPSIA